MAKLNRDEILRGLLQTLVDGWGHTAVLDALQNLGGLLQSGRDRRGKRNDPMVPRGAVDLVAEMELAPDRRTVLSELAKRFDDGSAFPKMGDIRAFLISHHHDVADLKGRVPAFKRMLPVLSAMSAKGLEKLLSRAHHSGPAELGAISDAIRGAGEALRGQRLDDAEPTTHEASSSATRPSERSEP